MIIVIMGVAGSGKTTVGVELANRIGWEFHDADDFHPPANVARMRSGTPLTDADRDAWLSALECLIETASVENRQLVLACSSLREIYRSRLHSAAAKHANELSFVYLRVPESTAEQRLRSRPDHFMPANLVRSQFETLEEPTDALLIDATLPATEIVAGIRTSLGL